MDSSPLQRALWILAVITLGWLGGCATHSGPKESLGTVLWVGDESYVVGTPGIGMRASSQRKVPMMGVRVQLDGIRDPVSYSSRTGSALKQLAAGQRVRVTYREQGGLFGRGLDVLRVAAEGEPR